MPTNKKSYNDALETARRLSEETKFVDWWVLDKAFNSGRRIYKSEWSDKNGNEKSV